LDERGKIERFDRVIIPHMTAAYNLARWLTRNDQDAEDVTQDACVRAFRFLDGFHGSDGRAWLLRVVRNTCYTWLQQNRMHDATLTIDDALDLPSSAYNPETLVLQRMDYDRLAKALEELPVEFREVMVLRELEGMSYKEISDVIDVPIGTVMSRLARARRRIQQQFTNVDDRTETPKKAADKEFRHGM
jgi:RNA polymerase sigma factor (sigma-70 family)